MLLGGHDESQLTQVSYLIGVNLISSPKEQELLVLLLGGHDKPDELLPLRLVLQVSVH